MMHDLNHITGAIVDTAYRLHSHIGPGLLESAYEAILAHALAKRGMHVERQKPVDFEWEGLRIEEVCRLDLLVEGCVVVELKSIETLRPVHHKQVLTYLRIMDLPIGLLINFGETSLKNGLHRIVDHRNPKAAAVIESRPTTAMTGMQHQPFGSARENSVDSADSV